jgi:hypothetical protein
MMEDNTDILEREIDNETAAIMKQRLGDKTRTGYERYNVSFMIWIFDSDQKKYHHLLLPTIIPIMQQAHMADKNTLTKAGQPSKQRTHLRTVCYDALHEINKKDATTIPVNLQLLSFAVFTRYLSTFKKITADNTQVRLSASSYEAGCSALSHLFSESGIAKDVNETTKELWRELTAYKAGNKKAGLKEKNMLGISIVEGKKPLPFKAYIYLAQILFESDKPEHIAAHTFLILQWNLISRAEFVLESKIDAILFQNDAMLFDVGKTKTDQEGTRNIDHPWHLYGNTEHPYICCFLAMGRHLINNPTILAGRCAIFEGTGQYDRFCRILYEMVSDLRYRDKFVSLGMPPQYFGTHSIRKGAVTHISTGTTSCPPIASICLRANWSMPGVMNRYIKYENAGDQFVGKCVSGRTRMSKEFGASPAYFDFSSCERQDQERYMRTLDNWIKDRMPEDARSNEKVFAVFKMCISSLEWHREFLLSHLHSNSNLRASIFLLEKAPLAQHLTVKYPWNKTNDTPELTGIPPDILIMSEFEMMKQCMENMKISIESSFDTTLKRELDARAVGSVMHFKVTEMMAKMDQVINNISKNNSPPLSSPSPVEEEHEFSGEYNIMDEEEEEDEVVIPFIDEATANQLSRERTKKQLKTRQYTVGFHHGKLNPLPSNWRYPKGLTLIQLINLWLIGVRDQNVPPLIQLDSIYVQHFDAGGKKFSKMSTVMRFVEEFGMNRGVWRIDNTTWNGKMVTDLWSAIWQDFAPYTSTTTVRHGANASNHKSRQGSVAFTTIYEKLSKAGKLKGNKTRRSKKRSRRN